MFLLAEYEVKDPGGEQHGRKTVQQLDWWIYSCFFGKFNLLEICTRTD
jgi:hypothetical protein